MPTPISTDPALASYLQQLEDRLSVLETPGSPNKMFTIASSSLTTANAVTYINCVVFASDLNTIAHSNGAHWYNESGALIV